MRRQVFVIAGACALVVATGVEAQTALARRGAYLAAIAGCGDCHSPMDQTGKVPPGRALTGAPLTFAPTVPVPAWAPVAPPIAGLPAGYTEAQLATLLHTGAKPDGTMARPPMPAFRMNEADAKAVTAYLKSLKPG